MEKEHILTSSSARQQRIAAMLWVLGSFKAWHLDHVALKMTEELGGLFELGLVHKYKATGELALTARGKREFLVLCRVLPPTLEMVQSDCAKLAVSIATAKMSDLGKPL